MVQLSARIQANLLSFPLALLTFTALMVTGSTCQKSPNSEPATEPATTSCETRMQIGGADFVVGRPHVMPVVRGPCRRSSGALTGLRYAGCGEGIDCFLTEIVNRGATDAPSRLDEAAKVGGSYPPFPVSADMIANASYVPGIKGPVNLPCDIYVDILHVTLDRLDCRSVNAANSGIAMAANLIRIVAGSDSSGATFAFTNSLASISDQWNALVSKRIDWPGGTMIARGNESIAGSIKLAASAIGDVEARPSWVRITDGILLLGVTANRSMDKDV